MRVRFFNPTSRLLLHCVIGGSFVALLLILALQASSQSQLELVESNDHKVVRSGNWIQQTSPQSSGGSYIYSSGNKDDSLSLQFTGTTFEIRYVAGPGLGMMAIEVDNTVLRTVMTTAEQSLYQQTAIVNYLTDESHTLKVYSQDGDVIAVDAFYMEVAHSVVTPSPDTSLEIDFSLFPNLTSEVRQVVIDVLEANRSFLPSTNDFMVTAYRTDASQDWADLTVTPTSVVQAGWDVEDYQLIYVLMHRDESSHWDAAIPDTPSYLALVTTVPREFLDVNSPHAVKVTQYRLPWSSPQSWFKTQGWHSGNALDFQPQNHASGSAVPSIDFAVLAAETGTLSESCNDGYQSILNVAHSDGTTSYVHLDANSISRGLIGQTISRGQYLGHLYTGIQGQGTYNGVWYRFSTACGYGTAIHLHFVVPYRNLTISGYNAETIANSGWATLYTSDNIRQDTGPAYCGRLYWDQTLASCSSTRETYFDYWIDAGQNINFEINRVGGNLEFFAVVTTPNNVWIASSASSGLGRLRLSVYNGAIGSSERYRIYVYPRNGTTGNYNMTAHQGAGPTTSTTSWDFSGGGFNWTATGNRQDVWINNNAFGASGWGMTISQSRDPNFNSPPLTVPAASYNYVAVMYSVNSTPSCQSAQLFFNQDTSESFNEARSVVMPMRPNTLQTLYFYVRGNVNWANTIGRLRFDPLNCGQNGSGNIVIKKIWFTNTPQPDTITLFNPATNRVCHTTTLQSSPSPICNSSYTVTNLPVAASTGHQWVMGDWNGDGLKTLGVYATNGVFYYTNTNSATPTWNGIWFGLGRPAVAGRFDATRTNDCIGIVDSGNFPPYGLAFAMYFTCDMSGGNPPKTLQWLSVLLPDSQGFTGTHQFGAGDFDGDGVDSIAVRRGAFIAYSNTMPTTIAAAFPYAQYIGVPGSGDEGAFVVGDWDNNALDSFGLFYRNGHFYRRNDLLWNSGQNTDQFLDQPVGTPVTIASWRLQ